MKSSQRSASSIFPILEKLIAMCIFLVFLYQVYWSWVKYQRGDTMMVSELQESELISFPSVHLCRGINRYLFKGSTKKARKFNEKLENWMEYTKYGGGHMEKPTSPSSGWTISNFMLLASSVTVCYTFTPPNSTRAGPNYGDSKVNIPHVASFGSSVIDIKKPEWADDKTVKFRQYFAIEATKTLRNPENSINKNRLPCIHHYSDGVRNFHDCIEKHFEDKHGCLLPWKNESRQCSKDIYLEYIGSVYDPPTFSGVFNKTGCMQLCEQMTYHHYLVQDETKFYNSTTDKDSKVSLRLYLTANGVQVRREQLVFDRLQLIGNVGGYLGLLIGWSFLSIINQGFQRLQKTHSG